MQVKRKKRKQVNLEDIANEEDGEEVCPASFI